MELLANRGCKNQGGHDGATKGESSFGRGSDVSGHKGELPAGMICLVAMVPFRWATISAATMAFSPFFQRSFVWGNRMKPWQPN